LAFHPYTQIIPQVFNPGGFGPPRSLTHASPCPCVDHPASGLQHATHTHTKKGTCNALFGLAFATAPPHGLTSPHTITRRLILQKARSHITVRPESHTTLLRLVGTRFQVLFHNPSPGRFSPFPHGTRPLSVTRKYLGLPGGPGRFTQDFTGPVLLGNTPDESTRFRLPGSHRLRHWFPPASAIPRISHSPWPRQQPQKNVPQPHTRNTCRLSHAHGLASSAFAHHYSRNHYLFSSPTGTEMFHFPALPPTALYIQTAATPHDGC
jgi:hypothetical protein